MAAKERSTRKTRRGKKRDREYFKNVRRHEKVYARQLRHVAAAIKQIVTGHFDPDNPLQVAQIIEMLNKYAEFITPWAQAVARRMVMEITQRDEMAWLKLTRSLGVELENEIKSTPLGQTYRDAMAEQVTLIRSIPLDAARRVHEMTIAASTGGKRASDLVAEIMNQGNVSKSKATLIARTEVARTSSKLIETRARFVGAEGYVWRTVGDTDVRKEHRELADKYFKWNEPPIAGPNGMRYHAGGGPNCFPDSVKISLTNGCHYLWRRWYEGSIVRVEFEGGGFDSTPNHPVLTRRGWIPVKDLNGGDYLIQSERDRLLAIADDENEGQPTFGELFSALSLRRNPQSRAGFLFDFHGERAGNYVDQIASEDLLPGHGESGLFKRVRDFAFPDADGIMREPERGGGLHVDIARAASGGRKVGALFGRGVIEADNIGLRTVAPHDALAGENFGNSSTVALETPRQRQFTFPLRVSGDDIALRKVMASVKRRSAAALDFDSTRAEALAQNIRMAANESGRLDNATPLGYKCLRLVDKRLRQFAGHVFTLQSLTGWYSVTSTGVIVKNCRCYPEPVLPNV